jgi:DNA-binding MarR family transcriptional regulator
MISEQNKIDILTEFFFKLTQGLERIKYKGNEVGMNIFLLNYLGRIKECTMKDIITVFDLQASTATRKIDKLVETGLVDRSTPENDRRLITLKLSQEGLNLYNNLIIKRLSRFKYMQNTFSESDLDIFFKIISHFNQLELENEVSHGF